MQIANRPNSGMPLAKNKKKKKVLAGSAVEVAESRPPTLEQDIQDGLDKFHAMLARYPIKKPKDGASYTLANKNLKKVYGNVKK